MFQAHEHCDVSKSHEVTSTGSSTCPLLLTTTTSQSPATQNNMSVSIRLSSSAPSTPFHINSCHAHLGAAFERLSMATQIKPFCLYSQPQHCTGWRRDEGAASGKHPHFIAPYPPSTCTLFTRRTLRAPFKLSRSQIKCKLNNPYSYYDTVSLGFDSLPRCETSAPSGMLLDRSRSYTPESCSGSPNVRYSIIQRNRLHHPATIRITRVPAIQRFPSFLSI